MTEQERELLMFSLTNSLAAKTVWQSLAVAAASKGPVTKRMILDVLFAAQTQLDFDATTHVATEIGDVSTLARDQIRRFRDQIADIGLGRASPDMAPRPTVAAPGRGA